ncbi:MAG: RapZ C-terminal domain-containing protein [Ignavibacteria bacterium]
MLKVRIFSFSYIYNGIPVDETGNGGGFVFDCRYIVNPGQVEEFKSLTGKDAPVKEFLDTLPEMQSFLEKVYFLIDSAIENYTKKEFTNLMVCFGCTGGQHRSVYAAEKLAEHLQEFFPAVNIELIHKNLKF